MDIAIVGEKSIKLKGKSIAIIVDPLKDMPKVASDATVLLDGYTDIDVSRVIESRIIISGAGEYEVGGTKISGTTTPTGTLYKLSIDNISVIVGRAAESKIEGFSTSQVAVLNTDSDFNESFVTSLEPKITVLYGDKKDEAAKMLGAENVSSVSKVTMTKDKLPEKMEIAVLG